MSEQTQAAAPVQPAPLTIAQAAQKYSEAKAAGVANPVSEAARTLGQRAAQARQERTTQAAAATQQPSGEGEQQPEENALAAPDGETTDADPAPGTEAAKTDETSDVETIDIGEGVTLTKAEIRENILRRADYTRKTEEVARERKALEAERSQKLAHLDGIIGALESKAEKPRSLSQWLEADPIGGLERFAKQEEQRGELQAVKAAKAQHEQQALSQALDSRDKHLAENYNKEWSDPAKRDADYTALSSFALKRGATPEEVRHMSRPWMIELLHEAYQHSLLKEGAASVTKLVSGKPQVVKPGAKISSQAAAQTSMQQAHQRLKTSGSIQDAVAFLQARRGR